MSRSIGVKIDRLVLRGIDPSDQKALVEGLRMELSRVLAAPELCGGKMQSRRTPVIKLGQMALEPGPSGGRKFGRAMARAIGTGVKR
jgi:hypothetical protein